MRVLFTTTPGWGHLHPMVPLAKALQARGADVAWAAPDEVAPRLEATGFEVFPCGLGALPAFEAVRRRHPEIDEMGPKSDRRGFPMMFGVARARPMLEDLIPIAGAWKPSLLVHEQSELAAPIVAALTGVPHVTHSFGELIKPENLDPSESGVSALWQEQGVEAASLSGCYSHMYLDIYPSGLGSVDRSHIARVQPVRPGTFAIGEPAALPDWIDKSSTPLVYVTFGTVFNENLDVVRTLVEGVGALPVRVVVTVGPRVEPAELGDQPPNVHVAPYVPQAQLLPRCAAVVSHGGSGTFLAALSHGLPQVCVPQGADQFVNSEACTAAGAGLALGPGEVTAEAVRASVETVLSDARFRSAARQVQAEIAAMPDPSAVALLLEDYVRRGAPSDT